MVLERPYVPESFRTTPGRKVLKPRRTIDPGSRTRPSRLRIRVLDRKVSRRLYLRCTLEFLREEVGKRSRRRRSESRDVEPEGSGWTPFLTRGRGGLVLTYLGVPPLCGFRSIDQGLSRFWTWIVPSFISRVLYVRCSKQGPRKCFSTGTVTGL